MEQWIALISNSHHLFLSDFVTKVWEKSGCALHDVSFEKHHLKLLPNIRLCHRVPTPSLPLTNIRFPTSPPMHHLIGRDEPLNLPGTPASRGRGEILRPFCFSQCHRLGGRCIKAALKSLEGSWGERLGSGGPSLWMPSLVPPPAACVLGAGRFPSVSSGSVEAQAHEVQVDKMLEKDTLEVIDLQGLAYFWFRRQWEDGARLSIS